MLLQCISSIDSRLPDVGLTIFSRMSALAKEHGAVNLGQGFPDFDCDPVLLDYVNDAMRQGFNQYPFMPGALPLRQAIAEKIAAGYGQVYDVEHEITVTAGATQAILCVVLCCVGPGDEVIIIEPAYDSYVQSIKLAGGVAKPILMQVQRDADGAVQGYHLPLDEIEAAINSRTCLLIINTPHNPTGTVWKTTDMLRLQEMLRDTNVLVCSDEVYEHMTYDSVRHESVTRYPELAARSFAVSSFGKTLHVTGWKVGYVTAPKALTTEFRKVHQYCVFTVNAPMQHGIAYYLQKKPEAYQGLCAFYQQKRDYFRAGLESTGLRLLPCEGTYFQAVDYSQLPMHEAKLGDNEFAQWLTKEVKVNCIPMSAFYSTPSELRVVRFCFAKRQETLDKGLAILQAIKK